MLISVNLKQVFFNTSFLLPQRNFCSQTDINFYFLKETQIINKPKEMFTSNANKNVLHVKWVKVGKKKKPHNFAALGVLIQVLLSLMVGVWIPFWKAIWQCVTWSLLKFILSDLGIPLQKIYPRELVQYFDKKFHDTHLRIILGSEIFFKKSKCLSIEKVNDGTFITGIQHNYYNFFKRICNNVGQWFW